MGTWAASKSWLLKVMTWTSGQDGDTHEHSWPPHATTAKITTRLQNKYHQESSENRAVWKSNNQGIKEITFIQIGKRDGDVETCNEETHIHVW